MEIQSQKNSSNDEMKDLVKGFVSISLLKYNTNIPWTYDPEDDTDSSNNGEKKYEDDGYDSDYAHWRK